MISTKVKMSPQIKWKIVLRWGIFLLGLVGLVVLYPMSVAPQYSDLKLNYISHRKIIAPFDFEILKSEDELARERGEVMNAVMPVFHLNEEVELKNLIKLDSLLAYLPVFLLKTDFLTVSDSIQRKMLWELNRNFQVKLSLETLDFNRDSVNSAWWAALEARVRSNLVKVYQSGILDREPETLNTSANSIIIMSEGLEKKVSLFTVQGMTIAKERILEHLKNLFPPGDKRIKLGYEISLNFLEPNLWYDKQITEQRRKEAANKVALAKGIVFKDERIIDANERVKQEHLDKLRSLAIKKMEFSQSGGGISKFIPFIGKALFAGGILFLLGFLIFNYRSGIATNKNLFLILLILLSPLAILQLLFESTGISRILFPSALASMLITIFYGYRVGFWYVIALSALAGTMQGNDFQLTISSIFIGSVGIVCVKQIRSRTQLLTSALYLTIAYIIILLAFNFLHYNVSKELWQQMGLAILNSLMTPILVLGFAIILGNLFDITTDLTLLELSDLNRPMLKQLSTQTPGTYHHSIMVGTLAEAAAEAVAANPLLARTGAYYHDIGKIERRDYYIENQIVFNPHDTLPPEESAKILVSHVDSGLELAEKHRLPKVIKEIIAQHHGTSLIKYFYHKALKMQNSNVNEEQYRYPGPLPVSKETGIIMLADTVEASVRSLGQGNEEELREIVVELVEERFRDGQLDKCELSVKDLQTVEDSFISTLKAQAHQRIAYPSLSEIENREQKIRNRKFYDEKSHNN